MATSMVCTNGTTKRVGRGGMPNYTPEQEQEIVKALRETDLKGADIAQVVGVPTHTVHNLNYKHRIRTYTKPTIHLLVPVEEDELESRRAKLCAELEAVERQIQDSAIRVKAEGDDIVVYGMGTQVLRANWRQWFRFLKNNGAAQVREIISTSFKEGKS